MAERELIAVSEVDPDDLNNFLMRFFSREKCYFLLKHGEWLHVSNNNRWVILDQKKIAGYCAIIPTKILLNKKILSALWWVDIIIAPEFRGQGYQSLFDKKIQESESIKLGFPNSLAAAIHKKHGWGVREDLDVRLLPLRPTHVHQVRCATGLRRVKLKLFATMLSPVLLIYRLIVRTKKSNKVIKILDPDPEIFSDIYHRYASENIITTVRDENYIKQRFIHSPFRNELSFYVYGPEQRPTLYLITRKFLRNDEETIRIIDLFGDLNDKDGIQELILHVIAEAIEHRVTQITIMTTNEELTSLLSRIGFFIKTKVRFCWKCDHEVTMKELQGSIYWTLADSDNDEID